ncbi:MAG: hypothetical protein IKO23_04660 [Bacteroidales bacterium]|nr:hypothetical protein [Bacteroidales bacterium]
MKNLKKSWMLAAILICGACLVGCGNKTAKEENGVENAQTEVQAEPQVPGTVMYDAAVNDYLVNVIGKNYAEAEYCIPCPILVSTDDGNKEDVLVWGDFWVFNYDLSGDTLKTVSGGNHPGLMHLKKTANGYEVTAFDAVEDGAGNLESAKRIFGDKFDSYQEISSLQEKREDMRLRLTADYVKEHGLSATMLQDYGWPAVALPQ